MVSPATQRGLSASTSTTEGNLALRILSSESEREVDDIIN